MLIAMNAAVEADAAAFARRYAMPLSFRLMASFATLRHAIAAAAITLYDTLLSGA